MFGPLQKSRRSWTGAAEVEGLRAVATMELGGRAVFMFDVATQFCIQTTRA